MKVPYKFKNWELAFKSNYNSIACVDSNGIINSKKKGRFDIGIYIYATDGQLNVWMRVQLLWLKILLK